MIEPKQRKEKSLLGSSRTKAFRLIRTGSALLLFAGSATPFYGQSPEALKTADKKSQRGRKDRKCSPTIEPVRQLQPHGRLPCVCPQPHCQREGCCEAVKADSASQPRFGNSSCGCRHCQFSCPGQWECPCSVESRGNQQREELSRKQPGQRF
jgi:hypothetical protein